MAGQGSGQRSNLTVNHGSYYIDTTVDEDTQRVTGDDISVFQTGRTYYVFFVFAKPTTHQTYQMYVGADPNYAVTKKVSFVQGAIPGTAIEFMPGTWPDGFWTRDYNSSMGLLTVTIDMGFDSFKTNYDAARQNQCQPQSFCTWDNAAKQCGCNPNSGYYTQCIEKNPSGQQICSWAVKDVDCPAGGCYGFAVTLSDNFSTGSKPNLPPAPKLFTDDPNYNIDWNSGLKPPSMPFDTVDQALSGSQCNYSAASLVCQ
jgi:hypothetical protein